MKKQMKIVQMMNQKMIGRVNEKTDCDVPRKKTKKQLANPKLSWFEENVIRKNIEERKELAKKLGIDDIAEELRKTAKDYVSTQSD